MCQPGEIVLLPFPFSEHTTAKKRPVLVLEGPDERGDFICLAVTSVSAHEHAFALFEEHFTEGRLPKASWVRFGKVYSVNLSLVKGVFGTLRPDIFRTIHGLFCEHFGCGGHQQEANPPIQ